MHLRTLWSIQCLLLLCGALPLCAKPPVIVPAAPPVLMMQGVGLAPLRAIADICGARITSDGDKFTVILGEHSFACALGSNRARVDGAEMTLAQAPVLIDGNCYVPLGELTNALGGSLTSSADNHGLALQLVLPGVAPFSVSLLKMQTLPPPQNTPINHLFLVKTDGSCVQQLAMN